jgi:hypothetical protein
MNSKEFVIWLKGFTEGVHDFNIIPKQWDYLKQKLAEVDDNTIPMGLILNDCNTFRKNRYSGPLDVPVSNSSISSITYTTGSAGWNYTATTDKTLLHD